MPPLSGRLVVRLGVALALVVALVWLFHAELPVNATTVALVLLLAIIGVSTRWGLAVSVFMSIAAALAFNFFFLPPFGTLTIAGLENWVAFIVFFLVAVITSNLAARAREEAQEATRRRQETEKLYAFSQRLLGEGDVLRLLHAIPRHIEEIFGAQEAALLIGKTGEIYRSASSPRALPDERLLSALTLLEPLEDEAAGLRFVGVRLGDQPVGSLGLAGAALSRPTLDALSTLIAIGLERAQAVEQLSKTEAARESERLKSALLDSIAHDFRTPLTSIKASVTNLLSELPPAEPQQRELLTVINEESDRLNRLVEEASLLARLQAGEFELDPAPQAVAALVGEALDHCKNLLGDRPVQVALDPNLPRVRADRAGARKVLVHLLENAHQYSPRHEPIAISADCEADFVRIHVADRGLGVGKEEEALIFEKFYRGKDGRHNPHGTGMGLPIARALAEAHGGSVTLARRALRGSVFTFSLPADGKAGPPLDGNSS